MKTEQELQEELVVELKDLDILEKQRVELSNEIQQRHKVIEELKDKIAEHHLKKNDDKIDWEFLLREDSGMGAYKQLSKLLDERGLYLSGYFQETGQRTFKIMMTRRDQESYDKTLAALKELLPFIKPLPAGNKNDGLDGKKVIGIFESTLSEHGVYQLVIDDTKNIYELVCTRYGRFRAMKMFASLRDALDYIQENHYYQDVRKESEE